MIRVLNNILKILIIMVFGPLYMLLMIISLPFTIVCFLFQGFYETVNESSYRDIFKCIIGMGKEDV